MSKRVESISVDQTIAAGRAFAATLKPGDVVKLEGDLGAGKTHFVKGVASYFEIDESTVNSPTFTLINEYNGKIPVYHFDCYRIEHEQEALEIGVEDYLYGEGISLVEWPDKIENLIPIHAIKVQLKHLSENKREILID